MAKRTGRHLYVVDVTGRVVHKPRAEGEECGPPAGAEVGYAPDVNELVRQGFGLCDECFRREPRGEEAEVKAVGEEGEEEAAPE